jgi:hypothetical protein
MAITVYWTSLEPEWMRAEEPLSMYKKLIRDPKIDGSGIHLCGGSKKYLSKVYGLKSIYEYDFSISETLEVRSDKYNQEFFDSHVVIRSAPNKLFSFAQDTVFFTEEKSLELSVGIAPFMEDNSISERCLTVPGTLDIGKWFRSIDFAFFLKNNFNEFKVNEGDIYQYIHFNTEEKIIFKKFIPTQKIKFFAESTTKTTHRRKQRIRPLENYYDMLKHKRHIIKEIKANLA